MTAAVSYLVAATQRSGSTLLCRALADTGVAGRPEEYFLTGPPEAFPPGWRFWEEGLFAQPHGEMDRESYLELVFRLGTTSNGVFGAKLMWNNVQWALEKLWELPRFKGLDPVAAFHLLFPNLKVIRLTRGDRVRQAVSWARAAQDGRWVVSDTEAPTPMMEPVYSFEFICGLERLLAEGHKGWPEFCDDLGVVPLTIEYEKLADPITYESTIRSALEYLGVGDAGVAVQPPRTNRQSNEMNDEWVERYMTEKAAAEGATGDE